LPKQLLLKAETALTLEGPNHPLGAALIVIGAILTPQKDLFCGHRFGPIFGSFQPFLIYSVIPAFLISMISLFLSMLGANHLFEHMVVKLHLRWLKHSFTQLLGIS
jgi:hypothetical protein